MNLKHPLKGPILITGATGFIGSHLMTRLLTEGYQVRALILPDDTIPSHWLGRVSIVRGSVCNPDDVQRACDGVQTIIHLVAKIGDWGEERQHYQITVDGSRSIFQYALENHIRVTLASSIVVYGEALQNEIVTESLPFGRDFGPYSRHKQMQEALARKYMKRGLQLSIVRPANVYGPGCEPWVHGVIRQMRDKKPALIDGGHHDGGLVHVDNVVDILIRASAYPKAIGQTYNAADSFGLTWNRYLKDLADYAGIPGPRSVPLYIARPLATGMEWLWSLLRIKTRPALTHEALNLVSAHYRIPMTKAIKELDYRPITQYQEARKPLRDYVQSWCQKNLQAPAIQKASSKPQLETAEPS